MSPLVLHAVLVAGHLLVPMQVKPGSFWAAYELRNEQQLRLPPKAVVQPIRIFGDSPPRKMLLFNEYEASSPFFGGRRLEANVIVRIGQRTHFVVLDYLTNVMGWNPERGIHLANAQQYSHTASDRRIQTRVRGRNGHFFHVDGLREERTRRITPDFAVRPNWECFFRNHPSTVKLVFEPSEICAPVQLVDATVRTSILREHQGAPLFSFVHPPAMDFEMTVE